MTTKLEELKADYEAAQAAEEAAYAAYAAYAVARDTARADALDTALEGALDAYFAEVEKMQEENSND